jgi:hypothetical protein
MAAKRNPAPLAAGRALDKFGCRAASNDRENTRPLVSVQAAFVARRFGLSAAVAALVAEHAFTAEARR